jgi:tripartite-type tricarboxylate transporter receptor subunit TctC
MSGRTWLGLVFGAVAAALTNGALAQDFPTRPISLVVSFAPGGLSDVPARFLAAEMEERIGQSIIVENKPGASGITGGSYVWRASPDGYTLLVSAISEVQNLHYLPVPYSAITDFAQVGKIADGPALVLIVNANSSYKSVSDLIADAKKNDGKFNFATSGPATSPAIAVDQFNALAGTNIVPVPYKGTGPAAAAVLSGEVQGAFVFYPSAKGFADAGKVRILAVASAKRAAYMPDIPTMTELGFKNFVHSAFVGLAAPRNTPPQVIAVLNRYLNETVNSPSFQKRIEQFGMVAPSQPNTPDTFAKFLSIETAFQAELAKLSRPSQPNVK